ncbi:MAG: translocation/assembly module TamB domain-containing protein [Epsilonproteobacteria bacterium]|nr:translocation/assembly module TamB domain-containing protein [Campylobacterota bacterium]
MIYFIANSPWVIKKAADTFAPDYNITYSRIHGNVLTGVEIEDLAYDTQPLAKHVSLKLNPNALIKKQIRVNHLALDKVNVSTIKKLLNAFSSDDNTSSEPFAFSVSVAKVDVDIDPFVEENVSIKNIILQATNIYYDSKSIAIGRLGLVVDTNITKVILKASLEKGIVNVETMEIQSLDTLALEALLLVESNTTSKSTEDAAIQSTSNPMMPTDIYIQSLEADILPRVLDPLEIDVLSLGVTDVSINVASQVVEKGHLLLSSKTNFADAKHEGDIKDNHLVGKLVLRVKELLFSKYDVPLRPESLGEIEIKLDVTQARIIAGVDTKMMQVLKGKKDEFNFDIDALKSTVTYTLEDGVLKADSSAIVTTPYAKGIKVSNQFLMDENISYKGDVFVKQLIGVDPKFLKPVNDLSIAYQGNEKSIDTKILSNMLQGRFVSKDFKRATLHIESKKAILLRDYVTLPPELNASKATVVIDAPLNFDSNTSYLLHMKVASSVANIDANMTYKEKVHMNALIDVPKKSLLRPYSEALKWDKLFPLKAEATLYDTKAEASLHAGTLHVNAVYDLNSTKVDGNVQLGGLGADITGIAQKNLSIQSSVSNIPSLLQSLSEVYTLGELPKVEGSANLDVKIEALKKIDVSLTSPLVSYDADHKSSTDIKNIDLGLGYEEGNITLTHYSVTYDKEKIFATKPSHISLTDSDIVISPLWVNDQLKAEGTYDLKTKKGKIVANAEKLHIAHEIIDLDSSIDITTVLDGNKTNVQGKIVILDGDIHYDISQKSFASDSDIVIVQDMRKEQNSTFMDNLSVDFQVKTKKPLVYNKDAIRMKADVDLGIHKAEYSDLLVLGDIELLKGSTYIFQEKKFVLEKSMVYFTGNPNKPLLDIKVNYKALKYLVTISITGSADLPNITFSSKPSLTKEQILSLILFDTEGGAGTNSGDEMMKMMGGAMAKSALNNLGVKIDHLVLGEGNSVEVGKKLTKKITIIYVNDVISEVKLKYEHSSSTESVISASERSESYDIIYKKDF